MTARLLTIDEAAELINKPQRWLRSFLFSHPSPDREPSYFMMAGRSIRIDARDIARIKDRIAFEQIKKKNTRRTGGYLYFIEVQGFIKIGWASSIKLRIANIQVGSPFPVKLLGVCFGTLREEKEWHKRFSDIRERGEWFRSTQALRRDIRAVRNHKLMREFRW